MAVVAIPCGKTVKITFDHGTNLDGERVMKTKSYSSIKSTATDQEILNLVLAIETLQEYDRNSINVEIVSELQD